MSVTTESAQKQQYRKMTETPVPRLVVMLGIPTTISMLVTSIYNMADTWFVGMIGTSASGAVGVVFGLMAIIQAFGFMFGHGAGSIISRHLGAKDVESATRYASTSFFSAFAVGCIILAGGMLLMDPLMYLLGSTDTILPYARSYAFFILLGAPFMASSCVMNNILRYEGRAAFAMVGLTFGGILNIFGDWLLMRRFGMGVEGAGLSTAVSQFVSFLILLYMFLSGKTQSKFRLREYGSPADLWQICMTGLPSLIRQGMGSVSSMTLNGCARIYGDAAVAAMSIVNRICNFIFSFALGIAQGFQPVSAFNYGARKYSRVRAAYFFTFLTGEVLLGCIAFAGMFFRVQLVTFFRDDPQVIAIGTAALTAQLIALLFQPFTITSNMLFQSIGHNRVASFLASLRSGLCFIPAILLLTALLGLPGVEVAQTAADILSFALTVPFVIRFFRVLPNDGEEENIK